MTLRPLLLNLLLLMPMSLCATASDSDDEPGLIENMIAMQYFAHKLALSIDADNQELADFYAHEMEETIEQAQSIESYDDQPIGALVGAMLVPAFATLEDALDEDMSLASARYDTMINSCNACHQTTGFGLIQIQRSSENPYMQSFQPLD